MQGSNSFWLFQQWHFVKTLLILIFDKVPHIHPRAYETAPTWKLIWHLYFHHKCSQRADELASEWVHLISATSKEQPHPLFFQNQLCELGFLFLSLDSCSQIKARISLTAAWRMPSLICLSHNKYGIILSLAATPFPSGHSWRWKVSCSTLLMQSFGSVVLNAWINAQVLSSILILAILSCWRDKCFFFSPFLSLLRWFVGFWFFLLPKYQLPFL